MFDAPEFLAILLVAEEDLPIPLPQPLPLLDTVLSWILTLNSEVASSLESSITIVFSALGFALISTEGTLNFMQVSFVFSDVAGKLLFEKLFPFF